MELEHKNEQECAYSQMNYFQKDILYNFVVKAKSTCPKVKLCTFKYAFIRQEAEKDFTMLSINQLKNNRFVGKGHFIQVKGCLGGQWIFPFCFQCYSYEDFGIGFLGFIQLY